MLVALNDRRYVGKICSKHPGAGGVRKKSNWICVICSSESSRAYRKTEKGKAYMAEYRPEYMAVNYPNRAPTRRVVIDRQTPPWADLDKIKSIYRRARTEKLSVDHIIPLRGELVSGLHVENNLQLLSVSENSGKRNKFSV